MKEQHFYADVNLPLHVWVRERAGARGYRWVLRNTADMKVDAAAEGRAQLVPLASGGAPGGA